MIVMHTVEEILARKRQGIDCTEDESVIILKYFDVWHPDKEGSPVANAFHLEAYQWWDEVELGLRQITPIMPS